MLELSQIQFRLYIFPKQMNWFNSEFANEFHIPKHTINKTRKKWFIHQWIYAAPQSPWEDLDSSSPNKVPPNKVHGVYPEMSTILCSLKFKLNKKNRYFQFLNGVDDVCGPKQTLSWFPFWSFLQQEQSH